MSNAQVRVITGFAGVAIGTASLVALPLYFMYSGPPPDWNVFTRALVALITCAFLIVFIAGLSHLIRRADADHEWTASLVYAAGMLFVAVALVAISLAFSVFWQGCVAVLQRDRLGQLGVLCQLPRVLDPRGGDRDAATTQCEARRMTARGALTGEATPC